MADNGGQGDIPQPPPMPCPLSPDQGNAVTAFVLFGKAQSGKYYSRVNGCGLGEVVPNGFTESMSQELYARTRSWVGL